jgi:hypothetical protein
MDPPRPIKKTSNDTPQSQSQNPTTQTSNMPFVDLSELQEIRQQRVIQRSIGATD